MADVVFVSIMLGFFWIGLLYIKAAEKL